MATVAFVTGVPRSGTSALARLLTAQPDIAIMNERYGGKLGRPDFGPQYFSAERARTLVEGESKAAFDNPTTVAALEKWNSAAVIGDKIPNIPAVLRIAERFQDPKIIAIVRDPFSVAQSFQARRDNPQDLQWNPNYDYAAAVEQHNRSMAALLAARETLGKNLLVVGYERVFSPDADLAPIFRFLGVSEEVGIMAAATVLSQRTDSHRMRGKIADYVSVEADFSLYRKVLTAWDPSLSDAAENVPDPRVQSAVPRGKRTLAANMLRYLRRRLHEQEH